MKQSSSFPAEEQKGVFIVPYYIKFWRHVNLAILKNPNLAALK